VDRNFYLEIIHESGQPVLDVGCGTGRLLLDYLSQGVDIDGVDLSPKMLAICYQKAKAMQLSPVLFKGNMQTIRLTRHYQTIIVPSSSFQLVLDLDDARQAIRNMYSSLQVGGSLVMPFMRLWKQGDPLEKDWQMSGEKVRPTDGLIVRRWSKRWFDPESQLQHTEDRFELLRDGVVSKSEQHVRSPATREYTKAQAHELYSKAGFVDIIIYKGFTRLPAAREEEIFTLVGKRL
jgi:ubiquinone/menaquinone biosynthesis C-methylase UbiE